MPVYTLGSSNSVGIVRKGRLCTGMFTSFLSNGEDIQRKLIKGYFGESGQLYDFISSSFEYKDIAIDILRQYQKQQNLKEQKLDKYNGDKNENINTYIENGKDRFIGSVIYEESIADTNIKVLERPPLRLGEIEGLNLMLIGVPEVSHETVANTETSVDEKRPPKQLITVCSEVQFVGQQINIQIDNPNIIEQVTFYAKDINNFIVNSI